MGKLTAGALLRQIFHPCDFSHSSEVAFGHALKIALGTGAGLTMMHTATELDGVRWSDFPSVRGTLARWGLISDGAPRSAVADLGIDVRKILGRHADPVRSCLHHLRSRPADLMVLSTHTNSGRARWRHRGVAAPLARQAGEMTLFVPEGSQGFVSHADGSVSLRSVLIPICPVPRPQRAVDAAAAAAAALACSAVSFTLLQLGEGDKEPEVALPQRRGWSWRRVARRGDVVDNILHTTTQIDADLLVMATAGSHGFLDALRGSTTERVLNGACRPLLAVPAV